MFDHGPIFNRENNYYDSSIERVITTTAGMMMMKVNPIVGSAPLVASPLKTTLGLRATTAPMHDFHLLPPC